MDTWFVPFTKEIGLPSMMAITFIWYFVRVFFPEQKTMMLDSIKALTTQFESSLEKIQQFNEKMLKNILAHNMEVHNVLSKKIDTIVSELGEFRQEVSKKLENLSS